jgi:hypothetical protein
VVMLQLVHESLVLFLYVCMALESFTPLAWQLGFRSKLQIV